MSRFIPETVEALFLDALETVPHPRNADVIALTLRAIEGNPTYLARHKKESQARSVHTVNKFGAMAVREFLGWEKEAGTKPPAQPFTTLAKTYSRLIPPRGEKDHPCNDNEGTDLREGATGGPTPGFPDVRCLPEIHDWITGPQVADMLGITRSAVHRKMTLGDFKTLHRLGDRPYLVVLRSEVERMKAERGEGGNDSDRLEPTTMHGESQPLSNRMAPK